MCLLWCVFPSGFFVPLVCLPASGSLCVRSRAFLYFHVFLFLESVWVSKCACTWLCVALPRQTSSCHSDQKAIIGVLLLWGEPSTLPLFLLSESKREANAERKRENRVAERVKKYMKKDWVRKRENNERERERERVSEWGKQRLRECQADIAGSVWELQSHRHCALLHRSEGPS